MLDELKSSSYHAKPAKLEKKTVWRSVFLTIYSISYWISMHQKLNSSWLLVDFVLLIEILVSLLFLRGVSVEGLPHLFVYTCACKSHVICSQHQFHTWIVWGAWQLLNRSSNSSLASHRDKNNPRHGFPL